MPKLVTSIAHHVLPREIYLHRQLDRTNGLYRKLVEETRRKYRAGSDEVEALRSEWSLEAGMLEEELEAIATNKLRKQAYRLKVPFPSPPYGSDEFETEDWERGHNLGEWSLKPSGYVKVRATGTPFTPTAFNVSSGVMTVTKTADAPSSNVALAGRTRSWGTDSPVSMAWLHTRAPAREQGPLVNRMRSCLVLQVQQQGQGESSRF